jgi:hypothetical protein
LQQALAGACHHAPKHDNPRKEHTLTDICSKRFSIRSDGFGGFYVRDRNAPHHPHQIRAADVPTVAQLAAVNEATFDRTMSRLCYGEN